MTAIDLTPIRMREARLTIEADDYTVSVNQVIFTPQPRYEVTRLLHDSPAPWLAEVIWSVAVGFAQDLTTPNSLSTYLLAHQGLSRSIRLEIPGRTVTAQVLILPAQIGGVANQIPASVVTLPLFGSPAISEV